MIRTRGLVKRFGQVTAVDGVDLDALRVPVEALTAALDALAQLYIAFQLDTPWRGVVTRDAALAFVERPVRAGLVFLVRAGGDPDADADHAPERRLMGVLSATLRTPQSTFEARVRGRSAHARRRDAVGRARRNGPTWVGQCSTAAEADGARSRRWAA